LQLASVPASADATALVNAGPAPAPTGPEVVTRIATSGNRHFGINVGTYSTEFEARKILLKTALSELEMLNGTLRKVVNTNRGYDANFLGMTEEQAALTCRRLEARGVTCATVGGA
jgi:D-alanyl-D-alanine carboxypeptidase